MLHSLRLPKTFKLSLFRKIFFCISPKCLFKYSISFILTKPVFKKSRLNCIYSDFLDTQNDCTCAAHEFVKCYKKLIGLDFKKYVEQLVNIGGVMHYSSNKSIINVRQRCECASAGGLAAHMCLHTGKCLITLCVSVCVCRLIRRGSHCLREACTSVKMRKV